MITDAKDLHEAWLHWWEIISKGLPEQFHPLIEKKMQGSFYCGASSALKLSEVTPKHVLWRACENGIGDACGITNMQLIDRDGRRLGEPVDTGEKEA